MPLRRVLTLIKGEIEVEEENILTFVEPLLGFEKLREFIIFKTREGPLYWLQSLEDPRAAFCLLAPFEAGLDPDYMITPRDVEDIAASGVEDIAVYTVVVLDQDPRRIRTNLRASIFLGHSSNKAKQVILDDSDLPIQCFLQDLPVEAD